ncbi:3-oxoadipate enol-lactonase [Microbulbifer taiwanensis]|uniref:3-oxoadipate enol-lactonase n=1 Tax=Microbulbifer taiwanensis TaxID=986746 RepID=UPI0036077412
MRSWDRVVVQLAQHLRCIRYDKRGHGLSAAPDAPYSIGDHADDLSALLDALQVDTAILCGLSVGGMIAMEFAQRHPDRARALILADTAHKIGTAEMWQERIDAIAAGGLESVADPILERWFTRAYRQQQQPALAAWRNMLCRTPLAGYLGTCAAIRDADLSRAASEIAAPTLCLCGDEDGATPPALVQSLAALVPGATFNVIEDAGHIPCVEQPRRFVEQLQTFFEGNQLV